MGRGAVTRPGYLSGEASYHSALCAICRHVPVAFKEGLGACRLPPVLEVWNPRSYAEAP